jgi:hypothetical protein
MRPLLALMSLGFLLFASEAAAQEVSVPETKNPHLRKIARLYDALEYEAALALAVKADRHPANKAQERLWLELMKGVLHYSLHDDAKADASFLKALEQHPYTSLPILSPSQTLHERFNTLRNEVLRARSNSKTTVTATPSQLQLTPPILPSLLNQQEVQQQHPQPQPTPSQREIDEREAKRLSPQKPAEDGTQAFAKDALSQDSLLNRVNEMEKLWRLPVSGEPSPKLVKLFDEIRRLIQDAKTPDAMLSAALKMDDLEELLKSGKLAKELKTISAQVAEAEFPDDRSQQSLLKLLSSLEAEHRQLTDKDLPPKLTILFEQVRKIIHQAQTPAQQECMTLWIQALALRLEDERQSAHDGLATRSQQARALSGISHGILIQRVLKMTAWFHEKTGGQDVHQDLKRYLELATQALVTTSRPHERMQLAASLDQLQERMRQRFDGQKQSANSP